MSVFKAGIALLNPNSAKELPWLDREAFSKLNKIQKSSIT